MEPESPKQIDSALAWLDQVQSELQGAQMSSEETPEAGVEWRLRLSAVRLAVRRDGTTASVVLCDGETEYSGAQESRHPTHAGKAEELIARAALGALNGYLETVCEEAADKIEAELIEQGTFRLRAGEAATYVLICFRRRDEKERLLGAALQRSWGIKAVAAAVLNAANRRISLLNLLPEESAAVETKVEEIEAPEEAAIEPTPDEAPAAATESSPIEQTPAEASEYSVGIHVSANEVTAALVGPEGKILAKASRPCLSTSLPETVAHQMVAAVAELSGGNGRDNKICGIGIALAGCLRDGICQSSPDFPGWRDVPIAQLAQEQLSQSIHLIEQARAALFAESRLGAGVGLNNVLFFSTGNQLACASMLEGRLPEGASGSFGLASHLVLDKQSKIKGEYPVVCSCGQDGCWQALASDLALIERAKTRLARGEKSAIPETAAGEPSVVTPGQFWSAAESGDSLAREVAREGATWAASGLSELLEFMDPEAVIISGPEASAGVWLMHLKEALASKLANKRCNLQTAVLSRDGPVLGAALLAREISLSD